MPIVDPDSALQTAVTVLVRAGAPADHARTQAEVLIDGELRGHPSHGLLRLPRLVARIRHGVLKPDSRGAQHWRAEALLEVDGEEGFGPVIALAALDELETRLPRTGIAMAAVRRSHHLGMLAFYADRMARRGHVLIATTTSEALVHPWGGRDAQLGTNPLAIGVPAEPDPFVLDMATSIISMGKVHAYAAADRPLEPGWAVDASGDPTTDAAAARDGALTPFGGAKGYGLGLGLELLVAGLSASAYGREVEGTLSDDRPATKGDLLILIDARQGLAEEVTRYLELIRSSPAAEPERPVTVPGDGAARRYREHLETGISVPDPLWNDIIELAAGERTE